MVKKQINEICKVDYVTNNLAECFNAKFKLVKGLLLWQAFDKIRQMIMVKMALRKRIAETQYVGHLMLPSLIKASYVDGRMHFILSPLALACNDSSVGSHAYMPYI